MKLRTTLLASLLLLICASGIAQSKKTGNAAVEKKLTQMENDGWQAWKDKNLKAFEQMLTDDSVNVTGSLQLGKAAIMKDMQGGSCDVKSFSLSDMHFVWIDKDAVNMTYTAQQDASCGGTKLPDKVWATSTWQNKGGKWVTPFHQETVAR